MTLSSGSAASRLNYKSYKVNIGSPGTPVSFTAGQLIGQDDISLDPNCPFFYIFCNSGARLSDLLPTVANAPVLALKTTAVFTNGGSVQSEADIWWGDEGTLDAQLTAPVMNVQIFGTGSAAILGFDPYSGICGFSVPGSEEDGGVDNGLCIRWTSLADSVRLRTEVLFACTIKGLDPATTTVTTGFSGITHGILQQAW